jgi:Ring finger domain
LASLADTPLFPPHQVTPAPGADPGPDPGEEPIHHVWYIRTVGLDEATIESIAVTKYQAGSVLLGSADCSVCLGDFQDGDLVRLLPKCGHAFHVPCIDTWLRAHVNCPVCRSGVIDPVVTGADSDSALTNSEASAGDTEEAVSEARDGGEVRFDVQSGDSEENENEEEVFVDIPLWDPPPDSAASTLQANSEVRERSMEPMRHRSASVDSPFLVPSVVITLPEIGISDLVLKESILENEQSRKEMEKSCNGSKAGSTQMGRCEIARSFSSSSGSGRSFFFSRSGRSRSSVLPL